MVYFFIGLSLFLTVNSFAAVHCEAERGQEVIELTVHDAFAGKLARIQRTHPLVTYAPKQLLVFEKHNAKSVVIANTAERFRLKIMKEYVMLEDGSGHFSGDLKFEDIRARMKCQIED